MQPESCVEKKKQFEVVSLQPAETNGWNSSAPDSESWQPGQEAVLSLPGHAGITLPPKEIQQTVEVISMPGCSQSTIMEHKVLLLLEHLEKVLGREHNSNNNGKALIFVSTRRTAEELGRTVASYFGLQRCGVMHGQRKQDEREATLNAFRIGRLRAVVATDVVGRGVDIPAVSHVVIFDFPNDIETYIHRVGRTGRNGRYGTAVTFFEPRPWYPDLAQELLDVLRTCGQEIPSALMHEAALGSGCSTGWGADFQGTLADSQGTPAWEVSHWSSNSTPPLDTDAEPALASAEELGEWDAGGARVWGYSANGGRNEQGRMEFRAGGKLRTTWGWGRWHLQAAEGRASSQAESAGTLAPPHMALSWNGCTDVVALDLCGLGFELVTRDGRPASTFKKKTLGRAIAGATL